MEALWSPQTRRGTAARRHGRACFHGGLRDVPRPPLSLNIAETKPLFTMTFPASGDRTPMKPRGVVPGPSGQTDRGGCFFECAQPCLKHRMHGRSIHVHPNQLQEFGCGKNSLPSLEPKGAWSSWVAVCIYVNLFFSAQMDPKSCLVMQTNFQPRWPG